MIENPLIAARTLQGNAVAQPGDITHSDSHLRTFQRVLRDATDHHQGIISRADGADRLLHSFDDRDDYITCGNLFRRAAALAGLPPYANSPSNTSQFWAREYGPGFPVQANIPYRSEEILAKLTRGDSFPAAVIVTHPVKVQERVAHYLLGQPELLAAPRIGFFQDSFPLKHPSLADQLSLSVYSLEGYLNGLEVVADSYFIMGGWIGFCLRRTISDLLSFLLKMNRSQCRIVIPFELCERGAINWAQRKPRDPQRVYSLREQGVKFAVGFFGFAMKNGTRHEYFFNEQLSDPLRICIDHTRNGIEIRIEFLLNIGDGMRNHHCPDCFANDLF